MSGPANAPASGGDGLDDRKAAILKAIVEQYVEFAQPVASQTVNQTAELRVSAATIRNEMSVLEREGYIAQPHTSAGRIPTDLGYRYYVDHLAGPSQLPAAERRRVAEFFTTATRVMDELLLQTSQLLARVSAHAAVVVGPQPDAARVRAVQLVQLQPRVLLVVVVCSNGAVEKEPVSLDTDIDEATVNIAAARLTQLLENATLADLPQPQPDATRKPDVADTLVAAACSALRTRLQMHSSEPLYVGGASRLAAEQLAFTDATSAARLLELLEQHVVLSTLMRELLGPGITVRIGSENERVDLRECSLVLAPYLVEGHPAGTVGILGPTRMDYRKAQAAVHGVPYGHLSVHCQ
jgi:heat-inducible transcriptional repressor